MQERGRGCEQYGDWPCCKVKKKTPKSHRSQVEDIIVRTVAVLNWRQGFSVKAESINRLFICGEFESWLRRFFPTVLYHIEANRMRGLTVDYILYCIVHALSW